MERVSFDIERQDVAETLAAEAAAHGRSVEQEVAELVDRTYRPAARHVPDVRRLRELARGLDFTAPPRQSFIVDAPDL